MVDGPREIVQSSAVDDLLVDLPSCQMSMDAENLFGLRLLTFTCCLDLLLGSPTSLGG